MSKYDISINGHRYEIEVTLRKDGGTAAVSAGGADYEVNIRETAARGEGLTSVTPAPVATKPMTPTGGSAVSHAVRDVRESGIDTGSVEMQPSPAPKTAPAQGPAPAGGKGKPVTAPLPGVILQICVSEGQHVHKGQKLAILEAMKMENDIVAEKDGTVNGITVQRGDSVLEDDVIMNIA